LAANAAGVERAEAEAILDGDRETAVALLIRVGELVEANERLEARVAELERRLKRSSRNSSLRPSQDPPSAPPRPGGKCSERGRGGQPGHEDRHRRLLPLEQVEEVVEHWPERCRSCAHPFAETDRVDAAAPSRHQVAELPPIAVRVTEHRLHRVCCRECAAQTRAEPPAGVSRSAFGPRLQAAVVTLAVRNRVSRRDTTELARELFGVELAGSVDAIALWTFTHTDAVGRLRRFLAKARWYLVRGLSSQPTTTPNAASAAPSIYRKLSLGSQSEQANAPSNDCSPPRSP
jgi:hypothetical protein